MAASDTLSESTSGITTSKVRVGASRLGCLYQFSVLLVISEVTIDALASVVYIDIACEVVL